MRPALAAAGIVLLLIFAISRRLARSDERKLVESALAGSDPVRAMAAIRYLGGAGIYRYRRRLCKLVAAGTGLPVLDFLAAEIADKATDRVGDKSLADLQLWAARHAAETAGFPEESQRFRTAEVADRAEKMRMALHSRAARRRLPLGVATLLVVAVFDAVLLVAPPAKGMGNNGDYERIMYQTGLDHIRPGSPANASAYFSPVYRTGVPVRKLSGCNGCDINPKLRDVYFGYTSSSLLLVKGALAIHDGISGSGLFDLRWLGVVNLAALLAGLSMLIRSARQFGPKGRLAVVILAAVAFSDVAYLLYFNSFFSEPAELAFLLAAVGAAATIPNSRFPLIWYAAFLCVSVLLVTAKAANVVFAAPLALAAVFLAARAFKGWGMRLLCWAMTPLLLVAGAWMFGQTPQYLQRINLYNGVFNGVLMHSDHPQAALNDLGLDPEMAHYRRTLAFSPDSGFGKLGDEFFEEVSVPEIGRWYLSNPQALLGLLREGAGKAFELRPPDLGNLPRTESQFRVEYADRSIWTLVHRRLLPHSLLAVMGVPLIALFAALALWRSRKRLPWASPEVLAAIAVMAVAAFALPLIVEGDNEIEKHMFMFNVLFDLCLISLAGISVNCLAGALEWAKARIARLSGEVEPSAGARQAAAG